jgi:hypothetical protein
MARTKEAWSGAICGQPRRSGRRIEIPVSLDNQLGRPVYVALPASKVEGFIKQLMRELDRRPMEA